MGTVPFHTYLLYIHNSHHLSYAECSSKILGYRSLHSPSTYIKPTVAIVLLMLFNGIVYSVTEYVVLGDVSGPWQPPASTSSRWSVLVNTHTNEEVEAGSLAPKFSKNIPMICTCIYR